MTATKPGSATCACGRTISANKTQCRECAEKPPAEPQLTGGCLEILNVGAGDVKIIFDKNNNVAETIRAKRIVQDMLRRGYALIVEVEREDGRKYERVQEFDAERGEYLIADFDPQIAEVEDAFEEAHKRQAEAQSAVATTKAESDPALCECGRPKGHKGPHKGGKNFRTMRIPMEGAKATAIGRSAGG